VHADNEWGLQKAKAEPRTLTAGHVREKKDGNPDHSAFSTEQEPTSLASKKKRPTLCVHSVSEIPTSMEGLRKHAGQTLLLTVVFSLWPKNP